MSTPLTIDRPLADQLEHIGVEFLADFFQGVVQRYPDDWEAVSELAQVMTVLKRHDEGLALDERLAKAMPDDSMVHYNLACSLCLLGRHIEALDTIEHAISLGYDDPEHMVTDEDLLELRNDIRFQAIAKRLFQATS